MCLYPLEPDDPDRKKKTLKNKIKGSKPSHQDSKPNISYPTNFEHTVHVGFDAVTGEFTVSYHYFLIIVQILYKYLLYIYMYILHFILKFCIVNLAIISKKFKNSLQRK